MTFRNSNDKEESDRLLQKNDKIIDKLAQERDSLFSKLEEISMKLSDQGSGIPSLNIKLTTRFRGNQRIYLDETRAGSGEV